jgi:hypothetical protein
VSPVHEGVAPLGVLGVFIGSLPEVALDVAVDPLHVFDVVVCVVGFVLALYLHDPATLFGQSQKVYSRNFVQTEFYEVGRAALVTFSTSWCLIHRLVLSSGVTKRQSNRSRRKGNTIGWVVWALMSVMLICLVLWAATGAVPLLFAAVLAGLRVLYVVLLINR